MKKKKKKNWKTIYQARLTALVSNSQNKCRKSKKLSHLNNPNLT